MRSESEQLGGAILRRHDQSRDQKGLRQLIRRRGAETVFNCPKLCVVVIIIGVLMSFLQVSNGRGRHTNDIIAVHPIIRGFKKRIIVKEFLWTHYFNF